MSFVPGLFDIFVQRSNTIVSIATHFRRTQSAFPLVTYLSRFIIDSDRNVHLLFPNVMYTLAGSLWLSYETIRLYIASQTHYKLSYLTDLILCMDVRSYNIKIQYCFVSHFIQNSFRYTYCKIIIELHTYVILFSLNLKIPNTVEFG